MIIRRYSELKLLPSFRDRFEYLALHGYVGDATFGFDRAFNQMFYQHSEEWKAARRHVIIRDNGCDLGCPDRPIPEGMQILVHHMNPISINDIKDVTDYLLCEDYLITTILSTHNAIHYGTFESLPTHEVIVRKQNDTCPWKL